MGRPVIHPVPLYTTAYGRELVKRGLVLLREQLPKDIELQQLAERAMVVWPGDKPLTWRVMVLLRAAGGADRYAPRACFARDTDAAWWVEHFLVPLYEGEGWTVTRARDGSWSMTRRGGRSGWISVVLAVADDVEAELGDELGDDVEADVEAAHG